MKNLADVSSNTVTRRPHDVGLFNLIGTKKLLISKKNKKARLQFAKDHQNWTVEDWKRVAFSVESQFNLFGSDRQHLRLIPEMIRSNSYCKARKVVEEVIWGIFSAEEIGPLVEINKRE